jgi:hypothetical protein
MALPGTGVVLHPDDNLIDNGKFQAPNIKQTTNLKRQNRQTTARTWVQAQARDLAVNARPKLRPGVVGRTSDQAFVVWCIGPCRLFVIGCL